MIKIEKPKFLWVTDWYDGPLAGYCEYKNKVYYFRDNTKSAKDKVWEYVFYELSDSEIKTAKEDAKLHYKWVTTNYIDRSFIENDWEKTYEGAVNPNRSEWENYYDNQKDLTIDITYKRIHGWFEF